MFCDTLFEITKPDQAAPTISAVPLSLIVGTSDNASILSAPVCANSFRRPSSAKGTNAIGAKAVNCVSPAINEFSACGEEL